MESASSVFRFSLKGVPERERAAMLREEFGRGVVNTDFVPLSDEPWMELETRLLPGVAITFGAHSAYLADSGYDKSRLTDDFNLVWVSRPTKLLLAQRYKEIRGDDGTAVLFSGADRLRGTAESDFHFVNVRMARSLLSAVLPRVENALMRPISPNTEALQLLTTYVGILRTNGEPQRPEVAHAVSLHIADLVALAVGTTRDTSEQAADRGLRAARTASVKAWILERIGDPALSVSMVAAAHGISPATSSCCSSERERASRPGCGANGWHWRAVGSPTWRLPTARSPASPTTAAFPTCPGSTTPSGAPTARHRPTCGIRRTKRATSSRQDKSGYAPAQEARCQSP